MIALTPVEYSVLDKVASGESHGYSQIYGGKQFHSFAEHPHVQVPLGNGQVSTAAGRYQLTAPTWQEEKTRLGLSDFSPASQDAAAWDLAERTYRTKTGRDLAADQTAGVTDWNALADRWTSLRQASARPLLGAQPQLGERNDLTITAALPQPTIKPLASLGVEMPQLIPVDHNPWSLAARLTPVDHDPFQQETSNAPSQ